MNNFALVIIAFNRVESLARLVNSLLRADYMGDHVDLVISIDNSGSDTVIKYAENIKWPYGKLKIIVQKTRLGLKKHVLSCGSLTSLYENICVLEDDLYVSRAFYRFSKAAIVHFSDFKNVAGISLYSHQWNPYVNMPFFAAEDQYDVYLLQVASSWGQIWNRRGWEKFIFWLEGKTDADLASDLLPTAVSNWSSKSWLKFYNRFLVDNNQYYIYPRQSLTTNFSDRGEHALFPSTTYQVSLPVEARKQYLFPTAIDSTIRYDSFFENENLPDYMGLPRNQVNVSMYENRFQNKKYLLTTKILNYKIIQEFGIKMRPIDMNVILNVPGSGIYLYDTSTSKMNKNIPTSSISRFIYDIKTESKKDLLMSGIFLYIQALIRKLTKRND